MGAMAFQITSLTIVYSTIYSGADQRKHQSPALLAYVRGIHRWPVNFGHKWPVTRKMFTLNDVIKKWKISFQIYCEDKQGGARAMFRLLFAASRCRQNPRELLFFGCWGSWIRHSGDDTIWPGHHWHLYHWVPEMGTEDYEKRVTGQTSKVAEFF